MKRILTGAVCFAICAAVLCGCNSSGAGARLPLAFDKKAEARAPESEEIARNDNYILTWDDDYKRVILTDLATGTKWSTTPGEALEPGLDELGLPEDNHPQVDSALIVEYVDHETNVEVPAISYNAAVKNGRVSCENIKNGLLVTYFFDEEQIAVPLEYVLRGDGLSISIDPAKIQEKKNKVFRISLAPFFCSVSNTGGSGYLFVPSGSGALIYPKEISRNGQAYSEEVYGGDPIIESIENSTTAESVRLPVYGAKSGDGTAVCAIIEEGAETAHIEARCGGTAFKYSSVYTTFTVRGYADLVSRLFTGFTVQNRMYDENIVDSKLTVGYYPLTGEAADYSGMAGVYRNFLKKTAGLEKRGTAALSLTFTGGTISRESFLGVPYSTLLPTTTLEEAREITGELYRETGTTPAIQLTGFGKTGIDPGEIGGGYKINRKLGSLRELNSFARYCREEEIGLYFDFDLVRLAESGGGFSKMSDGARGLNNQTVYKYRDNFAHRDKNTDYTRFALLSRGRLSGIADSLISKTRKWDLDGYSLATLTGAAYSDYSGSGARSGVNMAADVTGIMNTIAAGGKNIMSSDANAFAAAGSQIIVNAPLRSSKFDVFDADIPFYQMIFRGFVPVTTSPVNFAVNSKDLILRAVESGSGLSYSLIANYDKRLLTSVYPVFYSGVYKDLKDEIIREMKALEEYYSALDGASIASHNILENGVRETVFENGTAVYVNYGEAAADTPAGKAEPGSFVLGKIS